MQSVAYEEAAGVLGLSWGSLTLAFQSYYLESCDRAGISNVGRSFGRWNSWCYKLSENLSNIFCVFQNRNKLIQACGWQ